MAQSYVGLVLERTIAAQAKVLPEARYGTPARPKDSVDWLVDAEGGTLFIEAKAARMRLAGKVDLNSVNAIKDEFGRLGDFVVQTYRTLGDALKGYYPHWQPRGEPIYPIVVTLDDWHAFGKPLEEAVQGKLDQAIALGNIIAEVVSTYPYTICSVEELEGASQTMAQAGIKPVMELKLQGEHRQWQMHGFLWKHFGSVKRKPAAEIFEEEWRAIGATARARST